MRRAGGAPGWTVVLLAVAASLYGCRLDPADGPAVDAAVRKRFPDVPTIGTADLAAWLQAAAAGERAAPVLLDARRPEEYAVSHLAGARCTPDVDTAVDALGDADSDTPVVAYCSVGYRSAELVRALQRRGYTRVRNLEGSLFRWANEGRPLVDADGPVDGVHPYGDPWSGLLEPRRRWRRPTPPSE